MISCTCLQSTRMMMPSIQKPLALLLIACFFLANAIDGFQNATSFKGHPAAHIHRDLSEESILECIVFELGVIAKPGIKNADTLQKKLICSTGNHGPTVMLRGDRLSFFDEKLRPGVTSLRIPTDLVSKHLHVDLDDPLASKRISISNENGKSRGLVRGKHQTPRRSLLADYHGFFKVLVVRVSDKNGHSPTYNAAEISTHIFNDNLSMASQYRACSNEQLSFTPALGGTDIKDGVVDVVVDVDLLGKMHYECVNAADSAINSSYDVGTSHTYIMYICPEAVDFGLSLGQGIIGGKKSWYPDTFGSSPFIQMHEIGHNLIFFHSGDRYSVFHDPTCIMGNMYEPDLGWGRMCFNAAKTWKSGWYSDQHAVVTPSSNAFSGEVVDVNSVVVGNVNKTDEAVTDYVVVKVDDDLEIPLYLMLHRLEGITSDMKEDSKDAHANRVNIVRQEYGLPSMLVGSLASGEEYCQNNWADTGRALHIKVSSIAEQSQEGGAKVSVSLDNDGGCNCKDSPLKMKVNFVKRNCAWVAKSNTEQRCEKPEVASHCPFTCEAETLCKSDSNKKFKLKGTSDFQGCRWVERKFTKQRCQMEGVASTCRATCAQFM